MLSGIVIAALMVGCGDDGNGSDGTSPRTVIELDDSQPGDVIALRTTGGDSNVIEWIDRRSGTIRSIDVSVDDPSSDDVVTVATIAVGTEGEQRGLLGHTVIDGVRFAAWTDPDTEHLLVGALTDNGATATVERIVWDAGGTAGGAVGGHLGATSDGRLVLGIGQLTDWAKAHGSGAMLLLDPAGPPDQTPTVLSSGYINPFAFAVVGDQLWVADNAVGDDTERIGAIDLLDPIVPADPSSPSIGRDDLDATGSDPRAPSAVVELPDGTIAVCGFLDGELRRWSADPPRYGDSLGPCLTGAAVLGDGTIVTATADGLVAITP